MFNNYIIYNAVAIVDADVIFLISRKSTIEQFKNSVLKHSRREISNQTKSCIQAYDLNNSLGTLLL